MTREIRAQRAIGSLVGLECDAMDGAQEQDTTFKTTWNFNDLHILDPTHLQPSRPLRAWERKPLLAFGRTKTGVKKIWKRAGTIQPAVVRNVVLQQLGHDSSTPTKKTTKRRCISSEQGVETQWERLASPQKRIVTRSSNAQDLVALPEGEFDDTNSPFEGFDETGDADEVDGTIIEVLDEQGRTIDIHDGSDEAAQEWTDEEDVHFDDTLLHLNDAIEHQAVRAAAVDLHETHDDETVTEVTADGDATHLQVELNTSQSSYPAERMRSTTTVPAGFVSPVKRHRTVSRRLQEANRRRSAPYAFAPQIRLASISMAECRSAPTETMPDMCTATRHDLADDSAVQREDIDITSATESENQSSEEKDGRTDIFPEAPNEDHDIKSALDDTQRDDLANDNCASKSCPSSTLMKYQPVQLRRSPRRKSSSPVKTRTLVSKHDSLHFIALSPIAPPRSVSHDNTTLQSADTEVPSPPQIVILESPVAPAEETLRNVMSPKKASRGRLSDDTSFLQAFLSRAAKSKSTAGLDVASKEAVLNRRESATVKHVMSSPDKAAVLAEMDPNSTSPSKPISDRAGLPNTKDGPVLSEADAEDGDQEDNTKASPSSQPRRSNRDRRAAERTIPAVPAKIMLRGNKPLQPLKVSEMQETILITKKNTKLNKSNAIPPFLRLEELADMADMDINLPKAYASAKMKSVTWNDTPEVFVLDMTATQAEADDELTKLLAKHREWLLEPAVKSTRERSQSRQRSLKWKAPDTPVRVANHKPYVEEFVVPGPDDNVVYLPTLDQVFGDTEATAVQPPAAKSSTTPRPTKKARLPTPVSKPRFSTSTTKSSVKTKSRMPSRLPAPKGGFAAAMDAAKPAALPAPDEVSSTTSLALPSPAKRRVPVFERKMSSMSTPSEAEHTATPALPCLASPAKKIRRAVIFGTGQLDGQLTESSTRVRETPGLGSPAKKRIR